MARHLIPSEPVAMLIRRHKVAETSTAGKEWCLLNGFAWDTIKSILRGKRKSVEFNTADRILCALGEQAAWHIELAEWYNP